MLADPTITLVIADDHPIARRDLRELIETDGDMRVLAEAGDGREAWEAVRSHSPRVAVVDVMMQHLSGIDIVRMIREASLPTAVVILTALDNLEYCHTAIESGALGYILKDSAAQDIVRGIRRAAEGDYFISPDIVAPVIRSLLSQESGRQRRTDLEQLTSMERRVLHFVANNLSTREIAERLAISPRTVERHRANIAAKLNLHGSFALLRFALDHRQHLGL